MVEEKQGEQTIKGWNLGVKQEVNALNSKVKNIKPKSENSAKLTKGGKVTTATAD